MTTTLTLPQVLRHAADNLEAKRYPCEGLEYRNLRAGRGEWFGAPGLALKDITCGEYEFRLAPKTITYTVKDQPEPLQRVPARGDIVYYSEVGGRIQATDWRGTDWQEGAYVRGNIFATREDAEAADRARMDAFKGAV